MKKVCCSAFGRSTEKNKIWGSAYHFNGIYEIDLLTHKMNCLGQLQGEDDICDLVESIEYIENKVLFVPGKNGKYFHVLDLKTKEQKCIGKNNLLNTQKENHVKRFFSFVWNNKAYVVCRDELSVYCFDVSKNSFDILFEDRRQSTFRCGGFSLMRESVAFLALNLKEVAVFNLFSNEMEYIPLSEKIIGVDRIGLTMNRIALYSTVDRKVYLLDRTGQLIKSFSVSSETESRAMMFSTEKQVYLIGITDWAQEIFQISEEGETKRLSLKNMGSSNVYFLNRVGDDLYAYELVTHKKNIDHLIYNAERCYQYRLGENAAETIEWETDGTDYEEGVINMVKKGGLLIENEEYNLEFIFQNIEGRLDKNSGENHHISIGDLIHNRMRT